MNVTNISNERDTFFFLQIIIDSQNQECNQPLILKKLK